MYPTAKYIPFYYQIEKTPKFGICSQRRYNAHENNANYLNTKYLILLVVIGD